MKAISTDKAPAAVGPYSQAISTGEFLFCSGQIPIDPKTNQVVTESIEQQARQVLLNLGEVLLAASSSYAKVVKTTIFLSDMEYFGQVNEVYKEFFNEPYPARATVAVKALPKGVDVEIEAIAKV
jgi:2-iminobutanoate/2-iminopropanoate deaminase